MHTLHTLLSQKTTQKKLLDTKTVTKVFADVIKQCYGTFGALHCQCSDYLQQEKTIYVKTKSSHWSAILLSESSQLCATINKTVGYTIAEKLRIIR